MYLAQMGKFLPGSPDAIFTKKMPAVSAWVESLGHLSLAKFIQGIFAYLEIVHILGLFMLGGAVILTCLRLIGVGLTSEPSSVVEKNTRIFLNIGVVLAIGSGIGMSNAEKLYNSEVFTVKMMAMVAGLIFSYFVMIPVAKAEGVPSTGAKVGLTVAMALWLFAMLTFSTRLTANVGVFHVMCAGALILFMTLQGKIRWVYIGGLAVLVVVSQFVTHVTITDAMDHDKYMTANKVFMYLTGFWIVGLTLLNIFGKGAVMTSNAFARTVGYATILVWVTVGAGGRWIGTS